MRLKLGQEWELGERIGGGGFGQVYAAKSSDVLSAVAKLVPKTPGAERELLFVNPKNVRNVIPIIDSGETSDSWVLIMPRADKSLRQHLKKEGRPLEVAEVVAVLSDIATSLVDLDGKIVHRDLKPENVLLLNGHWCLADFGISRYAEASTAPDTKKFAMTFAYAAPERWREERATTATDVYSLGVIAFELLAGRLPFQGPDGHNFREQHLHGGFPANTGFPAPLAGLVEECMHKAPGARPSTANVLARLERIGAAPQSPAIARLRSANQAEVQRRGETGRKASEQRSEGERRQELYDGAGLTLTKAWNRLLEVIKEAAPSARVASGGRGQAQIAELNQARLELLPPTLTQQQPWGNWEPPVLDVIAHASLSLKIPPDRHGYEGRSHSLWYCDAQEVGRYQWFETAFMLSPFVQRRTRQNPYAMDPGEEFGQGPLDRHGRISTRLAIYAVGRRHFGCVHRAVGGLVCCGRRGAASAPRFHARTAAGKKLEEPIGTGLTVSCLAREQVGRPSGCPHSGKSGMRMFAFIYMLLQATGKLG